MPQSEPSFAVVLKEQRTVGSLAVVMGLEEAGRNGVGDEVGDEDEEVEEEEDGVVSLTLKRHLHVVLSLLRLRVRPSSVHFLFVRARGTWLAMGVLVVWVARRLVRKRVGKCILVGDICISFSYVFRTDERTG